MNNPFTDVNRPVGDLSPLCPWQRSEDELLYVDIDHAGQAFQTAKSSITFTGNALGRGYTVLISGGAGCGKTALMHRIAAWLHDQLSRSEASCHVLDLTREGMPGIGSQEELRYLCGRMIDRLGMDRVFDTVAQAQLNTKRDEYLQALPFLADLLQAAGKQLVLLLPASKSSSSCVDMLRFPAPL